MKTYFLLFTFTFLLFICSWSQEYATFTLTGVHQGTGTFTNAVLSDFTWVVEGTLYGEVQILDDEVFDDGNEFENIFGQADFAQNLRIKVFENGAGTSGQPITSQATLTIDFDQDTPSEGWGFCLVDIDVENALISAIDENDNEVSHEIIDNWLIELFDANLFENGINIPKWDSINSALLGSDTPETYVVYNNLVIGGMPSSEAPAAFFMPDIPLKSLIIDFENLQENYNTSYHFYLASLNATGVFDNQDLNFAIYPNPTKNKFEVRSSEFEVGHCKIELSDLFGKPVVLLFEGKLATDQLEFNVGYLKAGIYFCRLRIDNKSVTKKLIIK